MPETLVSRYSFTLTPRSILRPACSANISRGRTPTPTTTRSASSVPPLLSVAFLPSMAATVSPRWKITPCSSCSARTKSPMSGPRMRSIGRCSGATTCTSMSRARSEAAASSPMKLAPMTIARLAFFAFAMMARLSASERSVWTCGWSAPGIGSSHRLGAGGEQQAVVGQALAVGEHDLARLRVNRGDVGRKPQVDLRFRIEARRSAAAPIPPARCRRDNPWTNSAGRPAAPGRRSAW